MNVKGLKTLKKSISLRNSSSLSNIATAIILFQATLKMGKSTNVMLNLNKVWKIRPLFKYGKLHTFTTPKITFTRRNIINKRMIDSYRSIWNTVLRVIDRYVRKHNILFQIPIKTPSIIPSPSINNYRGVAIDQDAVFVSDYTTVNNHFNIFESTLSKLKSKNFLKAIGMITRSNDRKKYYAFDLQIDASNSSQITRLNCGTQEKTQNSSLFKHRRFRKVIYRPNHKRKCSKILKRSIHVKNPVPTKVTKSSLRKKVIEEFSSIISDNSKNSTQLKCITANIAGIKKQNTEEMNKKINMLTKLENIIQERIVHDVKPSRNIECNSPSVTTIIRNNFAVHSYISNPISLLDLQDNLLRKHRRDGPITFNTYKKCDIQYGERKKKVDRNLYNDCINLRPINNNIMNIKRQLSNFSGAQTFIAQKKNVNTTRFASTITNKNLFSTPKMPLIDKYMFVTDKQLRSNPSNDYTKYNESMLMSAGNEKQFLSLMSKLKHKINYNEETEKSRLNAISKQLEQIRNIKKMLNLYSDEENFKTNHHYQPGEPKYELNCAPSKYLKATSARIISKIQDEINREPIIPSPPPRRQSLLRLPKTINGNIGTSRLIQELNSTASRMFQASLKNMHSVTNTRQDNKGKVRYGGAMPPKIVSKTVIEEYNPNKSSKNQYQTSPLGEFDSPNKFSNNLIFPRPSIQFVPKDKERNLSRKNTTKSIDERTFSNKVTNNENIMSNPYLKDDTKKSTPENGEDLKTVGTQYEQFYKNHLVNYEDFQANFSKSSNNKINATAGSDQNNDEIPQQSMVPEFESSVTPLKKSTSEMVSKNNTRFAKSENRKSTNAFMKPQSQSLTNTGLKFQSQPSTNNFIKPQSFTNFQYSGDGKSKFEEQKLPTQTNLRTNDKELLQNKVNVKKNQDLKQNVTEYAMKETTSKTIKNISSEENKSPRNFLRRGNGPKPPISYAINVNKTAMVKEHLEKYSKRRLNMLGDKRRKEANSDGTKPADIIQESTPAPIVNKKSDEYKMNITIPQSEKTAILVKPPQKTKSTSQSIQTQTMRPKVQKSASFVASNAKRDESIKLATSFNLPHTSRKTILESNQRKENMLNSELEFFSKETEKPLMGLSPRFIDLHDIEKNVNKPREEMPLNNKIKTTNESKRLVIDDFESGFGYDTSTSITTRKNPTSTQQFSVSSSSPYVTKLIDIPPSMHSPLIARKIHKVGITSVKSLHNNKESYAVNKIHSSPYKSHTRQIMTNAGRLRGGEDRINSTLERLLSKAQNLTKNLQNIRSQCQEYVEQLEKCNFETTCSCDSLQCTCNGLNFNQNANNGLKSAITRKHISRSTLRNSDYEFQNPCMEGPFSDILTRHFLPGNKGKMPAIVGYKTDGIPIYGPPGAAYNVMGWTRDGSPIFGRGGPGSKEPLLNIRGYFKTTPLYEPTDPEEKNKITQIGTYDNTPITGHRDLINGMVFVGKTDKGFGKYKVLTKTQKHSNTQNSMAVTPTTSERESIDSEEMKRALNSFISNEPIRSLTPDRADRIAVQAIKSKTEKPKVYPLSYSIGNIRCNKYHKKCISTKYRSCSAIKVRKSNPKYLDPWRHSYAKNLKRYTFKPEVVKDRWTHKPGEIMKPVARTIKMHRRRLGLQNPERLLKTLEKKNK